MSQYRTHTGAITLRPRSSERLYRCSAETDNLRSKAARYRGLAETLVDPRVVAVVQACALDLETQALLAETADCAVGLMSELGGR